ncbi:MAG: glutaredoxin family protein [Gammaproteobacteria bacterium]
MTRLLLLGTEGCHLCEEAQDIIAACVAESSVQLKVESIDIAEHPEWQHDYSIRIPVLLDTESRREIGWPFDHAQIAFFLQQVKIP